MTTADSGSMSSNSNLDNKRRSKFRLLRHIGSVGKTIAIVVSIATLIVGGIEFYIQQQQAQQQALDQEHQATLDGYLDDMSNLLLMSGLRTAKQGSEVQVLTQARTYEAVRNLDGARKGTLVRFLWEAGLLNGSQSIISLNGADLSSTDLSGTNVSSTNASGISSCASITENCAAAQNDVNLSDAILSGANLSGANLSGANLSGVNLLGATYNTKPMQVKDAQGNSVTLGPTQWPQGFNPQVERATCLDC